MRAEMLRLVDEQMERSRLWQQAAAEAESRRENDQPPGPIITISRQLGSGGKLVAQSLADKLKWSYWDKELVDAIAKDADVNRRVVESFDERTISEIEVLARTLAGERDVGGFLFKRHLLRALLAIARRGNAIILGRGANFLLPGALNVRVIAHKEKRVENLIIHEGLARSEAENRVKQSDKERARFVKRIYEKDINDSTAYDLTVVTDRFGVGGVAEIVIKALESHLGEQRKEPWTDEL